MVYTGKPSRACAVCKSRRIKCDEDRPSCGQCLKSRRSCPGYSDDFDLVFRDENKALVKRSRKKSAKARAVVETSDSSNSSRSSSEDSQDAPIDTVEFPAWLGMENQDLHFLSKSYVQPPIFINSRYIPPSLTAVECPETVATKYFFEEFVQVPRDKDAVRGFLEFLEPIFSRASSSSPLIDATHAVALATFGMMPGRSALLERGGRAYARALLAINSALLDPQICASDEMILAVLMFSLYEAIASKNNLSASAWNKHVDGAVALIRMRGAAQFEDPISYNIFRAVRAMMLTNCIQREKPVEPFPGEHSWYGLNSKENAANRLTLLSMNLPTLKNRYHALSSIEDPVAYQHEASELLANARALDSGLEDWFATLPTSWQPAISSYEIDVPSDLFNAPSWPGPQYLYDDVFISSILCDYRVCRIFCNTVILGCLEALALISTPEDAIMTETPLYNIQKMVDETCAIIPFHIQANFGAPSFFVGACGPPMSALSRYFVIWPLLTCSRLKSVPERQRTWMYGRLMHIGRAFGLDPDQIQSFSKQNVLTNAASLI